MYVSLLLCMYHYYYVYINAVMYRLLALHDVTIRQSQMRFVFHEGLVDVGKRQNFSGIQLQSGASKGHSMSNVHTFVILQFCAVSTSPPGNCCTSFSAALLACLGKRTVSSPHSSSPPASDILPCVRCRPINHCSCDEAPASACCHAFAATLFEFGLEG